MSATIDKLCEKAWELRDIDNSEAFTLASQAHQLSTENYYQPGLAASQLSLSYGLFKRAEYAQALEYIEKALSTFETLDDLLGMQRSLNTQGMIYGQKGDLSNALAAFLKAHKLCQKLNDQEAEGNALNNLSIIYMYLGDYYTSLDYNLKGLKLYQSVNATQNVVKALQNIGVIYYELKRYEDALEYFQQAKSSQPEPADKQTYALIFVNIGRAYQKLGKLNKAIAFQKQGLDISKELDDKPGRSNALDALGLTYLSQENYQEAEALFRQSLALKREIGDIKGEIESSLHLGELLRTQNLNNEALAILENALALAMNISAKAEVYKAHRNLSEAFKVLGKYLESLKHLERFIEVKDSLFNDSSDHRLQALRVHYEVEQAEKEKEIYRLKNVELARANAKLKALYEKLERQALEDPLTKLYNRRHFEAVLKSTYAQSYRYKKNMSVMICDVDNFKRVNDTFSHAAGDEVLIQIAQLLKQNIREADTVARYGGEEFVILFPETTAMNAAIICNRIRDLIQDYPWNTIQTGLKVTISLGLCDDITLGSGETMIARADDALYSVKHNGKNHVRIWQENSIIRTNISELQN